MEKAEGKFLDSLVVFQTSEGLEIRASLLRLSRFAAAVEVYSGDTVIKSSEVLRDCRIFIENQVVYAGRAIVQEIVPAGTMFVCSLLLDDLGFDSEFFRAITEKDKLRERFRDFFQNWETVCRVLPEFKVAVADIVTFLTDLRHWVEQVELAVRSSPKPDRVEQEADIVDLLSPEILRILDNLFGRFESIAASLPSDARPVHRAYIQRHLHPIVLCAPFAYRSYQKPLGYAGDYEMVNMMLRDPREGSSLFAKIFNVWLLHQHSAAAHRNRVQYLKQRLVEQTLGAMRAGEKARILNIGCGPAFEVQQFIAESELSNHAQFTLLDFDPETLRFAGQSLRQQQVLHRRSTSIQLVNKSVQQLLKDSLRGDGSFGSERYDLAYCAGLFDYLPDRTCKRLMSLLVQSLKTGGLALATNVTPFSPNRGSLELILDWNLIYRDVARVEALCPADVPSDLVRVESDATGVNVFLEIRKPNGN